MTHELKCDARWFDAVWRAEKTAEVRRNDRDYKSGDRLRLIEMSDGEPTGRVLSCVVGHILTHEDFPDGLQPGYAVLSLTVVVQAWVAVEPDDNRIVQTDARVCPCWKETQ